MFDDDSSMVRKCQDLEECERRFHDSGSMNEAVCRVKALLLHALTDYIGSISEIQIDWTRL